MDSLLNAKDPHFTDPVFIELRGYLVDKVTRSIPPYGPRFAVPVASDAWVRFPGLHSCFVSLESFSAFCVAVAERDLQAMMREKSRMTLLRVREALDALGDDASETSIESLATEAWGLCTAVRGMLEDCANLRAACQAYVEGHAGALGAP